MGIMKRQLEDDIAEFAEINGLSEEAVYNNKGLYNAAVKYSQDGMMHYKKNKGEKCRRDR